MKISVIVPLFNEFAYIQECIESLVDQDYPTGDYEILMVDNNSRDGTSEAVRRHTRIRLLSEKGQGAYRARNRGILAASGDLLAFTDSDCRPNRDWLAHFAEAASGAGADIVMGRREFASGSKAMSILADYENVKAEYVFSSEKKQIYYGYTNNMAVRRRLFEKLGKFVEVPRGADTVFVRKAVETRGCGIVTYSPGACVRHLEMRSVRDYYRKKRIYGSSTRRNQRLGSAQPLNSSERMHLYFRTVRTRRYSFAKALRLFALLSLGMFAYESGRRSTAIFT